MSGSSLVPFGDGFTPSRSPGLFSGGELRRHGAQLERLRHDVEIASLELQAERFLAQKRIEAFGAVGRSAQQQLELMVSNEERTRTDSGDRAATLDAAVTNIVKMKIAEQIMGFLS